MPSINLRLTEEEHAELERWARDGHRSLQKEIIFRLFTMDHVRKTSGAGQIIKADAQPRDIPARTIEPSGAAGVGAPSADSRAQGGQPRVTAPEDHFHPDPKPERKRK